VSRTQGCINKSFKPLNEEPWPKQVCCWCEWLARHKADYSSDVNRRCAAETGVKKQLDMLILVLEIPRTSDWRPRVIHACNVACSGQAFPGPLGDGAQKSVRQIACLGILLYSQVLIFITGQLCRVKNALICEPDVRRRPSGPVHEIHDFRFPSLNRESDFFK